MNIVATSQFNAWLSGLKDLNGRARIQARIQRFAAGNPGHGRRLSATVSELKIDVGPGYRVYYALRRNELVILLAGGDKSTQVRDIALATALAANL
ncbi:type II toxin-antitoxin system RelE/ParE family toxin [Schauerella aestuarii]|uniref:type II toxin-antitoxin system RelE/ParE family toxin n=1 Tax=Schauerella aestuarii TaxID=2511204 RepID=UPI00136ABF5D|nr:type II toxin-antitoxin system RelE/ParE family toxin [Achromobacter aestuarii]MYZ43708.1 type II toxin-antitoxin system RelE/ParE family toxin [Achromobacter aestuarii]